MLSANFAARLFGATFILVGLLGFAPNPVVSPTGIFAVNAMHNLVHLLTGAAFLIGCHFGCARRTILGLAVYYVAVAAIGFITTGDMMLGVVHINAADRWLHACLAFIFVAVGVAASPGARWKFGITSDQ